VEELPPTQTASLKERLGSAQKGFWCVASVTGDEGRGVSSMRAVTMRQNGSVDVASKVEGDVESLMPMVTLGVFDLFGSQCH